MLKWLLSNSNNKQQLFFHVALGWISLFTPVFFIIWYYLIFLVFFQKIIKQKFENSVIYILIFLMYSSSFEILGRMSNSSPVIPYELGKYMTFFLLIIGLFKVKNIGIIGIVIVLCLIPGIIVGLPFYKTYKDLVFNVLGTINIGLGIALFANLKITESQLFSLLKLLIMPMLSILAYSIFRMPDLNESEFELGANKIVGGFGSNQIATVFGIAIFVLFVFWNKEYSFSGFSRWIDIFILFLFLFFGLLTFSRGGIVGGFLGILFYIYFQTVSFKKSFNLIYLILVIPLLWAGIYAANELTDGNLLLRYSGETNGTLDGNKEKNLNQLTTGRFNLFIEDIELFQRNPILGLGVKQSVEKRDLTSGIITHVELGRLFSEHGLFGLILGIIFFYLLFRGFIDGHKSNFNGLVFILYMIGFYTSFHAATRTFVSPLLMPLIFLRQTSNIRVDNKNINDVNLCQKSV
jgi:hypothetical protein